MAKTKKRSKKVKEADAISVRTDGDGDVTLECNGLYTMSPEQARRLAASLVKMATEAEAERVE